ncbi:MAG TPA: isoprenylcysteine carboxylmethyltransferase family protein [Myxococcota bacterium]|nr:isoprenylcysteine carboxylmethyltransferase family protein [Myxococcota bacterium]
MAKVYIPVLFPLTFLIALTSLKLDGFLSSLTGATWIGDGFLPAAPTNYVIAGCTFVAGVIAWLMTYEQLVNKGEGSPSPTAGRTRKLVVSGIYAYCRNPSIWGKLIGVLAVGFLLNSISFCFVLIPALLAVSLTEKVWRQEPQLVEVFGEDYLEYQKQVPLFVPWGLVFPSRKFQGFSD